MPLDLCDVASWESFLPWEFGLYLLFRNVILFYLFLWFSFKPEVRFLLLKNVDTLAYLYGGSHRGINSYIWLFSGFVIYHRPKILNSSQEKVSKVASDVYAWLLKLSPSRRPSSSMQGSVINNTSLQVQVLGRNLNMQT